MLKFSDWLTEATTDNIHPDYNLIKTGKESTVAHPNGKPTHDLYHNGKKVATIKPYSAYKDTKAAGSRVASSRKDVTKYVFTSHVPELKIPNNETYGWSSSKDAAEGFIERHQRYLNKNEGTELVGKIKKKTVVKEPKYQTTVVSAPIRGANQDQSGFNTISSTANYTVSY